MEKISRRDFFGRTALLGGGALLASTPLVSSCCGNSSKLVPLRKSGEYYIPELPDKAIDGRTLKLGLVGCGGRGTGAVLNVLEAADGIEVTALGDVFADRLQGAREEIAKHGQLVPEENCFVGFDAYKKVIDSGIDMVILTTPPVFRPAQFQYATSKGVHSFLEKPVSVDAKGYRQIMATAKQAAAKGLAVVTGTQRHHERRYIAAFEKVQQGLIGEITGGNVYWNQDMLWYKERQKGWSDMEWNIRDWVNWKWLSGDHIVEQHVHNIDVFMWFAGNIHPISAVAFGSRQRRVTGDQYDNFSVDFEFENGVHMHSMCRQINGTSGKVGETIQGTRGMWSSFDNTIRDLKGNIIWQYENDPQYDQFNPYVLEHVDWINHIRKGEVLDEASFTGISSLAGAMGREAAYTGKQVTWDEMSAMDQDYLPGEPDSLVLGDTDAVKNFTIPVPGK